MRRKHISIIISVTVGIILLFGALLFLGGKYILDNVFGEMCGNEVLQEIPSDNGEKVAYIFQRDCGATTGYSYELSILDKGEELPNKNGNTFLTEKEFTMSWIGEKKIQVVHKEFADIYKKDKRVNGVRVEYVVGK